MCVHRFVVSHNFIYSCAHKCTCPLQNMQIVVNFNKIGWIMKIPYYCLFNNTLNNLPQELLIQFYSAIMESVLCISITVWFSSATKSDLRRLRRVVRTAERIESLVHPPHSPRTVLIQSEQKDRQNHSGPLTSSTLPL